MNELTRTTITSMEAAEWCGKEHAKLLRDIRKYTEQLGEAKIGFTDFFKESTYVTDQNKTLPCFLVTKKGCEFIAHKMTGQKGTEFRLSQLCGGCHIFISCSIHSEWHPKCFQMEYRNQ